MRRATLLVLLVMLLSVVVAAAVTPAPIPSVRPPPSQRRFNSTAVNNVIDVYKAKMRDADLATLLENCLPNTLDTTVVSWSANDTFVITGDLYALWLRDSTNQVLPYIAFLNEDETLKLMVRGLVLRQLRSVLIDPYANAFNFDASGRSGLDHQNDLRSPPMQPAIFEGKYELDSLCAVLKLARRYVNQTADFGNVTATPLFLNAVEVILQTMANQTASSIAQGNTHWYRFFRDDFPWEYDVYPRSSPTNFTGMVRSAFRPSDDSTDFDFNVAGNIMALVELRGLVVLLDDPRAVPPSPRQAALLRAAKRLVESISNGLQEFGGGKSGAWLHYEVDGYFGSVDMDDANVPSLLSIPYLTAGVSHADPGFAPLSPAVINATRSFVLSSANPFYFCGTLGCGVGSPHTWPGFIWPMALIMRAMTSSDDAEIITQLELLKTAARFTGLMHESFSVNDVKNFTRPWFAWANTLFGELILSLGERKPHLIFK